MLKSAPPVFFIFFVNMGSLGNLVLTFELENDILGNNLMRTKGNTSASKGAPASIDLGVETLIL